MDKILPKKYLSWVKALYPGKKIGIIGDNAAAHISEELSARRRACGIVIELVFAGMTSGMQPCDIWLNRSVKKNIRTLYYEYKNSLNLKTGEKVCVPREMLVKWVEEALKQCNDKQKKTRAIANVFAQCALSPFDKNTFNLKKHISPLPCD